MTKVICINNDNVYLILDKVYDGSYICEIRDYSGNTLSVPRLESNFYEVINEKGRKEKYSVDRFIALVDWREAQINSILND